MDKDQTNIDKVKPEREHNNMKTKGRKWAQVKLFDVAGIIMFYLYVAAVVVANGYCSYLLYITPTL